MDCVSNDLGLFANIFVWKKIDDDDNLGESYPSFFSPPHNNI